MRVSRPGARVVSGTLNYDKGGVKADKGSKVKLVISNGPPNVKVPDILCKTRAQAAAIVASVGLKIKFEGSYKYVVDQDPAFLRYLTECGLDLGTVGELVENRPEAATFSTALRAQAARSP